MRRWLTRITFLASLVAAVAVASAPTFGASADKTIQVTIPASTFIDMTGCPLAAGTLSFTHDGLAKKAPVECRVGFWTDNGTTARLLAHDMNDGVGMQSGPNNIGDIPTIGASLDSSFGVGLCLAGVDSGGASFSASAGCPTSAPVWHGMGTTDQQIAQSSGTSTAVAHLWFGGRVPTTQVPGDYTGQVIFTVVAT